MQSAVKYHQVMSEYGQQSDVLSFKAIKHALRRLIEVDQSVYPPLFAFVSSFVIFFAGVSVKWLTMMNLMFLAVLLIALFQIVKKIHSERAAVLAATLFVFYPGVFNSSREFMLEIALLAMAALSIYLLLYSEEFAHPVFTALFGASVGLGLLTKLTYLSYIVGPVCAISVSLVYKTVGGTVPLKESVRRLVLLSASTIIGLLVAGLWYGPNYERFSTMLRYTVSLDTTGINRFDIDSWLYYLNLIIVKEIGLPFFILFIIGLFRTSKSLEGRHFWLLSTWALSIYVILSLQTLKHEGMIIGILLPLCIVSAIGLFELTRLKAASIGLVLVFGLIQFITLSFPEEWVADKIGRFNWAGHYAVFPKKEDWKIEEALKAIANGDPKAKIGVVSDHIYLNGTTLKFYASNFQLPLEITTCNNIFMGAKMSPPSFDFIIAKSDTNWIPRDGQKDFCTANIDAYRMLLEQLEDKSMGFEVFKKISLPDATEMLIYRRSPMSTGASKGVRET
jgi:hypothetical protein